MSPSPADLDQAHDKAMPVSQARARTVTAAIRLAAGGAFLGLVASLTVARRIDLGSLFFPALAYVTLAAVAFAGRRRPMARRLSLVMPFFDVALTFIVHRHGMRLFPPFAASWAVSSLGIYTLIVAVVGLSMPVRMVVVLTLLSAAAEMVLLRAPGITLYVVFVAICTLAFTALATSAVPRIAEAALRQEQQAAITLDSLEKAREQNRQFELVQREKDALLEIIVHDMRSPVGAAMLSLEYLALELRKRPSQAPLLEATDDALITLNSLSGMITQILDTSKLEGGRITLRLDDTEVSSILERARAEAAPRAGSRAISIGLEAPAGLTAALDLRLFPRALEALMTHLLRRTPEGGRMLLVATGDEREVRVSLHATAPAVPASERERIFDKFPFAEGEPRRMSGWGPGLYFCQLVAGAHQGAISIEDVDGWPTSFVIRLPGRPKSP
jgi:two-component system heavy metal sensor histidine kinase CusS